MENKKTKARKILLFCMLALAGVYLFVPYFYERYKIESFPESDPFYMEDAVAGFIHKPDTVREFSWSEHENETITMKTNNLGFRENRPTTPVSESVFRILVTGDSHVDGVVDNLESFPNLLEATFRQTGIIADIINGGTGYYSFRQYDGFVDKYSFLEPDYVVVTVYMGNDFIEALMYDDDNMGIVSSQKKYWYRIRKKIAWPNNEFIGSQAMNQALYFKIWPSDKEKALSIAKNHLLHIHENCIKEKRGLLILLLPSKYDVEDEFAAKIREQLAWTEEDMQINKTLTSNLSDFLVEHKIDYINLLDKMQKSDKKLFWELDHHLNCEGHKLVAKILGEYFETKFISVSL